MLPALLKWIRNKRKFAELIVQWSTLLGHNYIKINHLLLVFYTFKSSALDITGIAGWQLS